MVQYKIPKDHIIVHCQGGVVTEIEQPKQLAHITIEVWDHDECKEDKETKENCPLCREELVEST